MHTPLKAATWSQVLVAHPDKAFARYLLAGITEGFRIGFRYGSPLTSSSANTASAIQHPEVFEEYLSKELSLGRMLGPFPSSMNLPYLQVNRVGIIPKGHNTGKWRLITDLSFPLNQSVNDGIDPSLCSLSYITVEDVAAVVAHLGVGTLLVKVDIESAYRLVPVHPQDRPLQAMRWKDKLYVDPMLPFGLRSAPKIFNAVADALNWHLRQAGIHHIFHYLDDFIFLVPPGAMELAEEWLGILHRECARLGIPLASHKQVGPTTCLQFLGIEIDTVANQLRLPEEKLQRLVSLIQGWGDRRSCSRKELESLVGHLNHACKVVRSGRTFLRRMLDLLHAVPHRPHSHGHIRLNAGFRSDLAWWKAFLAQWNGISYLPPPSFLPQLNLYFTTDASGSWGCGAWHGTSWFKVKWDSRAHHLGIAEKELIPIVIACFIWGNPWYGHQIRCYCDNQAIVACLHSRTSKQKGIMHLLRCLLFVEAQRNCNLTPAYISTEANHLADDLSRDHLSSFFSKLPQANPHPTPVPPPLLDLLLDTTADWTSEAWSRQFSTTSGRV